VRYSRSMARGYAVALLTAAAISVGCASHLTNIAPLPPNSYEELGPVTGKACGSLGIVSTAYYVIPMGLNSRVERAYQDALNAAPGATALIDVTMKENWYWWIIGEARCLTLSGEAIR